MKRATFDKVLRIFPYQQQAFFGITSFIFLSTELQQTDPSIQSFPTFTAEKMPTNRMFKKGIKLLKL